MAEKTRLYTIPLRREFQKVTRKHKTPKAVVALKEFVAKHMKVENVFIGEELNELIWKDGISSPPPRVKVEVTLEEDGAFVNLVGFVRKVTEVKGTGVLGKKTMKDKLTGAMDDLKGKATDKKEVVEDAKEAELVKEAKTEKPQAEVKAEPKAEPVKDEAKEVPKKETPKAEVKPEVKQAPKAESPKVEPVKETPKEPKAE